MSASALESIRATLAAAAEGVRYTSEGEAPFTAVALPPAGGPAAPFGDAQVRRAFGIGSEVAVTRRSLDEFFRPLVEDVDPADAVAQSAVPRARALREAIRRVAPDAAAFRAGSGPEVRYFVVGPAPSAGGAVAGVETVGFES
jgi:hypothetical protein